MRDVEKKRAWDRKRYQRVRVALLAKQRLRRKVMTQEEKEARRAYLLGWRKTPTGKASTRKKWLKRRYGLTLTDFEKMLTAQGRMCACCNRDNTSLPGRRGQWNVDHDHKTGLVRGVLCFNCNVGIGLLYDDARVLRNAAAYLERAALQSGRSA